MSKGLYGCPCGHRRVADRNRMNQHGDVVNVFKCYACGSVKERSVRRSPLFFRLQPMGDLVKQAHLLRKEASR